MVLVPFSHITREYGGQIWKQKLRYGVMLVILKLAQALDTRKQDEENSFYHF